MKKTIKFVGALAELKPVLTEKAVTPELVKQAIEMQSSIYELKVEEYYGEVELWSELFSGTIDYGRHYEIVEVLEL